MIKTKFHIGDRVRNLVEDSFLEIGDVGTVMEDNCTPFVKWDEKQWGQHDKGWYAQLDDDMEVVE